MKSTELLLTSLVLCGSLVLGDKKQPSLVRNESIALFDFWGGRQTSWSLIEAVASLHGQQALEYVGHSKRQTTCVIGGYVPCPNIPTKCCPAGDDCFPSGCCPAGHQPCGSSHCYNPSISHCCADGTSCQLGYDCNGDGTCCPSGQQPCGSSHCYNPSTSHCCADGTSCLLGRDCNGDGTCCPSGQQPCGSSHCYNPSTSHCCADGTSCQLGYDCNGDGTCCPSGEQPCGKTKCYHPESQKCCTASGLAWGCGADEECCAEGGASACYIPSSEQCCSGGSCSKDRTCCGNECCGEDSNCGSDGYCTAKPLPTNSRPKASASSTSRPTASASSTSRPTALASATSRPTPSASAPTAIRTITFRYDPDRKVATKNGALYEATNKAVLQNMCEGIKAYLGFASQSIELTRTDASTRKSNRKAMCPKGYCASALKDYLAKYYPSGIPPEAQQAITMAQDMSCDEFPFAISAEGGNTARGVRFCIPCAENSWQGGVMSSSFKEATGVAVGERFKVTIEGFDCETMMPEVGFSLLIRRDGNETSVESESMWKSFDKSDSKQNLITLPLGDLDAGDYEVDVNVSITSRDPTFTVLTYDGRQIEADVLPSGKITFNLDDAEDAVGIVGVTTQDEGLELTYESKEVVKSNDAAVWKGGRVGVSRFGVLAFMVYVYSML